MSPLILRSASDALRLSACRDQSYTTYSASATAEKRWRPAGHTPSARYAVIDCLAKPLRRRVGEAYE